MRMSTRDFRLLVFCCVAAIAALLLPRLRIAEASRPGAALPASVDRFRTGFALDLGLDLKKLPAPGLALALGAFVNGIANSETVVARLAFIALKLPALRTRIKRFSFSVAVFLVKHVFAGDAHGRS
jgi:hypothetical protein